MFCFLQIHFSVRKTIGKYHLFFIYDVKEFFETLDKLENMQGRVFIPSHCEACETIDSLVKMNRAKVTEVAETNFEICEKPVAFEDILKQLLTSIHLL